MVADPTQDTSKAFVVRYRTHPDRAEENRRLIEQVFAELTDENPGGLRYATFQLEDGVTFVHVALHEGDGRTLARSPAFARFQRGIGGRVTEPPMVAEAAVVGSYRFPVN
ncbi:hypothetical protein IU450_37220 [Nocardia abscessus]|uniref:hypothetical protein n=1 Tax=Nocardia abscessus TaxID=120957 RepID=UPI00189368FB|nr:hypothetical protein [Nocardia abscessus]MBF6341482.1 hypothetical protein [Nocardia abscessus]